MNEELKDKLNALCEEIVIISNYRKKLSKNWRKENNNMEINKQLFEDILAGKLKGTFVLRDGKKIISDSLQRTHNSCFSETHPYSLVFNFCSKWLNKPSYKPNGKYLTNEDEFSLDIIDFIPETNMKENDLIIEIPIGYEIDKSKSTFERIVFKKKDTKPRSWEEYLCSGNHPNKLWYISLTQKSTDGIGTTKGNLKDFDLNKSECYIGAYLPSKELAEAFRAMMKLMSLRQAWIDDWKPNWSDDVNKYCIVIFNNKYIVDPFSGYHQALSFPTKEMAEDFMNCFKDLLEIAKPLI